MRARFLSRFLRSLFVTTRFSHTVSQIFDSGIKNSRGWIVVNIAIRPITFQIWCNFLAVKDLITCNLYQAGRARSMISGGTTFQSVSRKNHSIIRMTSIQTRHVALLLRMHAMYSLTCKCLWIETVICQSFFHKIYSTIHRESSDELNIN